jgi:hypothetical protein
MRHFILSNTTHTVEVSQVNELNDQLTQQAAAPIHAADLQLCDPALTDNLLSGSSPLPASAVLVRVSWAGAPQYPYIHGHFGRAQGARTDWVVDLHTDALRLLCRQLHLHQVWGTGSATR